MSVCKLTLNKKQQSENEPTIILAVRKFDHSKKFQLNHCVFHCTFIAKSFQSQNAAPMKSDKVTIKIRIKI